MINRFFAKGGKVMSSHKLRAASFKNNPFSMQWGVYVDFFDEKSVDIDVFFENELYRILTINNGEGGLKEHRHEARKAALEKAIEIYNQNT